MAKAPASEQLRLLELAALDGKGTALTAEIRATEADSRLEGLRAAVSEATAADTAARAESARIQKDLTTLEHEVETLDTKIKRDTDRMNAGGLSKDLVALQKEVDSLQAAKGEQEDRELELMEEQESAAAAQEATAAALAQATEALTAVESDIDARVKVLWDERAAVMSEREAFAATIEPALVEIYHKTRERRGVGAARLFHGRSEGSGMELSPGDLAEVRAAAEDDVVFCPDSGVILVRNPEWN